MFLKSSSMLVYGLLIFFIGVDSTPIPTVLEGTVKPDGLGTVLMLRTSEIINQPTTNYFTPEEGITKGQTLPVVSQQEITSGENIAESEHENTAREVVDFDEQILNLIYKDADKESLLDVRQDKKDRARKKTSHLFKSGAYEPPRKSFQRKKSIKMQFTSNDKVDESVQHFIDQENKGQNRYFLFDNNVGDEQSFTLFGKRRKGNANKTHFLFDDDLDEMRKLTFSSSPYESE